MKLSGRTHSEVEAGALWRALREPARLAEALPGVRLVDVLDDRTFHVLVTPTTALGATPFALDLRIDEEREPEHVRVSGGGRSGEHVVELEVAIDLTPAPTGTTIDWAADVRFLGVLGSIGQRVLPHLASEQIAAALTAAGRPVAV